MHITPMPYYASSVTEIYEWEFFHCSSLTSVVFCDEIEVWDWWNHGVHEKALSTHCIQ